MVCRRVIIFVLLGIVMRGRAWDPWSWRSKGVPYQIPSYDHDVAKYTEIIGRLKKKTPLVFAGECRNLKKELAEASVGKRFIVMGGDCAETFEGFSVDRVRDDFFLLLRMAWIVSFASGKAVTPIGRCAGQFAKPRSVLWDPVGADGTPPRRAYQGDIVNGIGADERVPDAGRMIEAYHQSVQTINLLRAFDQGNVMDLHHRHHPPYLRMEEMPAALLARYTHHLEHMEQTIRFIESTTRRTPSLGRFYTGHECLLLPYEAALTRIDSTTGSLSDPQPPWYDTSAHFLWLGERTRRPNASHIEFLRGIQNPIGIKISGTTDVEELRQILALLNPRKEWGKIMLISRMGAGVTPLKLPAIVRGLRDEPPMVWCVDPMHGNTYTVAPNSTRKTRKVGAIHQEIREFYDASQRLGFPMGGLHLEMTSRNVTECVGGAVETILPHDIESSYYESVCDPRLNGIQSIETAFLLADLLG